MKNDIKKLIDGLARKDLTFGCILQICSIEFKIYRRVFGREDLWEITSLGRDMVISKESLEYDKSIKIIGHEVFLHDVLDKLFLRHGGTDDQLIKLFDLWQKCGEYKDDEGWVSTGFLKSLNQIYKGAEWVEVPAKEECKVGETNFNIEVPKDQATKELFKFILLLNLIK